MYLYFDNNGILKEIVDDVATRKGNNEVNRLYIYVDGITPKTEWITYQTSDGVQSNETLIETTITKTIPYDRNRDLKYFKNFQEYLFYVATIPSSVLTVSGLTKASVRVALQDDSLMTLGLIIFTIEESVVLQDSFITESQYQYLLNIISNFEELNNTGVIGISTQIVNGAVAPYDQGRIVLSTYNDNFTVATVVKNSTGQNVYNVLDMTFVKQVPYDNSKPNLEGLEINGKKYKVAYKTSQLNNDAGFITNAVSNLINYYTKTTIDEKFANIDLSEYYTKTESDGRYVLTTNFSWNNLANKPTSLSDFVNDEGFITNTVSNLSNYYDKTTIDNIVATLKTGAFQVVSELPSTGEEGIVYLVGTQAPYTMYIWENNAFLDIGTTEVNLDGYVKGTNLNTNYVILGNGGSNVVASTYTINNQNANDPNSLLTAKVINTLLGTKQDILTGGQGINISDNVVSTPVSTTSTTIAQQSVNKLKYDGKPILVDYAVNDDSGRNIADTYATFNDLHTLDIGDITSSSNIYQTLYQNVYENDTTKKNVVIFSTDGFVDSATSLISSGEHIATPYQDNKILIDSVFVLNSDNSATTIISSDTVVIDLGTLAEEIGTLSPDMLSKLNNAISENKNIVIKMSSDGMNIFIPNVIYSAGANVMATGFMSTEEGIDSMSVMIDLPSGQYMFLPRELQEKLYSEENIKTINNQSILGKGDIKISPSKFQIIDVSRGSSNTSISKLYNSIINSENLNFTDQADIDNNISTAINNGLVPILKFEDGYGYYIEKIPIDPNNPTTSGGYVFTLNHITDPKLLTNLSNNVITLKVGNTSNEGYYNNLSQIPYTIAITSGAFGDSGSLSFNESNNLKQSLSNARSNVSTGIFIFNFADYKIYSVSIFITSSYEITAYSVNNNVIEVLTFTKNSLSGKFDYTKSTYALGGGGSSASKMINLGTLSNSGTLDVGKLQELMTLFQNGDLIQATFTYNNAQFITASAYSNGSSMGIVAYTTVAEFGIVGVADLSINMANASYTITPFALPSSFKKINGVDITGNGNIEVQNPLVSGTTIKTINNKSILDSGNLNLQERLYSGENIKTVNGQTILGLGDIRTGLPAKQYKISSLSFTTFENGQTATISDSDSQIIQSALSNNATVLYDENLASYLPMLYVDSISNIQILYNDTTGNCGIVSINLASYTATISMVFNTAPYSSENDINNLSNYELPLTTEKSTELWTNVGTAIQTFNSSSKTESDKATLKEALSVGFGIPFCYILKVNFIAKYNSYLDNVVNNLTNSSITSEQISQALSYANQINTIITTIGNDASLTSSSQRTQLNTLVNQFCTSLGWSGSNEATFYTISDSAGATLIRFNKVARVFSTKKIITLENLYVFMNDLYDSLRNKI